MNSCLSLQNEYVAQQMYNLTFGVEQWLLDPIIGEKSTWAFCFRGQEITEGFLPPEVEWISLSLFLLGFGDWD